MKWITSRLAFSHEVQQSLDIGGRARVYAKLSLDESAAARRLTVMDRTPHSPWRRLFAALTSALRRIAGAPSYDLYLAHMRVRHPDATPMCERDFVAARLSARYDKPGARCC